MSAVVELTDGVLAVRESDNEHTIYFDKSKFKVRQSAPIHDGGPSIRGFPADVGFIEDVQARSWGHIRQTAERCLENPGRRAIQWHAEPMPVTYP